MNSINFLRKSAAHSTFVEAITQLSLICARNGVASAQGLRIIRRRYPELWEELTLDWNEHNRNYTIQLINNEIKPKLVRLAAATRQKPSHFLLDTNIVETMLPNKQATYINIDPDVHFIRTQRRYNKRRYARVRATSRPSFWAGMLLSTLVTAAFWGASLQEVDWVTTAPILTDVNTVIAALYLILGLRLFKLYQAVNKPRNREQNKRKRGWKHVFIKRAGRHIRW